MPETLHRTPSLMISVSGASVWLCIAHGPADLPLHLEVTGEALVKLSVGAQRAVERRRRVERRLAKLARVQAANDAVKGAGNG